MRRSAPSDVAEAAELVRKCAEPVAAGESIKALIRKAARKTGLPPDRLKAIWYAEARQVLAYEMDSLRREAAKTLDESHEEDALGDEEDGMTSAVYFLEAEGSIKIGFSRDLRVRQIALGGSYRGAILGGREVEKTLHEELAAFLIEGEWFHRDPILLATIDRLIAERGIAGESCVSLTDPALPAADALDLREKQVVIRVRDGVRNAVKNLSQNMNSNSSSALEVLASELGCAKSMLWRILYRPPGSISAAFLEALLKHQGVNSDEELSEIAYSESQAFADRAVGETILPVFQGTP